MFNCKNFGLEILIIQYVGITNPNDGAQVFTSDETGAFNAAISGGNVGQGILTGAIGGLLGSSMGLGDKSMTFWEKAIVSTVGGGFTGGVVADISGGNFWEGFRNGAIGGAVGFATREITDYLKTTRENNRILREKLGLTKEDIKQLKHYGLGRINLKTLHGFSSDDWNALKALKQDYNSISKWLNTRDYQTTAILKSGDMHVRYGTKEMIKNHVYGGTDADGNVLTINEGDVNIHFDRVDDVLFPLTHLIVDTFWQSIIRVH